MFYADLHIHSKYSRATSKQSDLEHMAIWARKKGVSVLGTGDFTHPAWFDEIKAKLVPAEPGLFRLCDGLERDVQRQLPGACQGPMRFMLEVEISTIYKKGERTRKVHHLIYAPDLEKAERLIQKLSRIGNLKSDGRPILGLDSRDLLEITLECGEGCYLVPAHIWTPWFAVLGSKSGFDKVEDCYGDLSSHIFALETGLSSDPPMNWRLSPLDQYTLVSNSDAHSPPKIGREACAFETEMDYFAIRRALETGEGYAGTVEFFPEEGKYHLDGHRKCGIRFTPQETRQHDGLCPVCGKNLTIGVVNRVDELADREDGFEPNETTEFRNLVPLPEVISEIRGVGEKSKKVQQAYEDLVNKVGSELYVLEHAPVEEVRNAGAPLVAEAVQRMREGRVICEAGYDGEYGTIRLFEKKELTHGACVSLLFDIAESAENAEPEQSQNQGFQEPKSFKAGRQSERHVSRESETANSAPSSSAASRVTGILDTLDTEQRFAAEIVDGPLLVVAGPGTGKTRTLTHRIAHLVADRNVPPEQCLAITFSRRAAGEMTDRLAKLLPKTANRVRVMTFHALGLAILREHADRVELPESFRVAGEAERKQLLIDALGLSERQTGRRLSEISQAKRSGGSESSDETARAMEIYHRLLRQHGLVDFDDLILLPAELLESDPTLAEAYRERWTCVSVDELQDIDPGQYRLIQQLVLPDGNICAIGDPDQAIYGFRGSDVRLFERFRQDFPSARVVHLTRNYRSSRTIVDAALQAIKPSSQQSDRVLEALSDKADRIEIQTCPTERAEAEFVVHTIERLIGGSTFFSMDSGRVESDEVESLSFNDIAALYRTDSQADALVEALDRSGMPYQKKSHSALSDEPAVQAMIEFINQAIQSTDNRSPDENATELLKQAADAVWGEFPEAATYLDCLYPIAERHGEYPAQFLTELAMGVDVDLWNPKADRVSLLTLHASKGLEFPIVFLVGCEDGLLPLYWGSPDDCDVAEERRLFFVGMTRARNRLFLSHAKKRLHRGRVQEMQVSPFLQEINDELLQRTQRTERRKAKQSTDSQLQLFQ